MSRATNPAYDVIAAEPRFRLHAYVCGGRCVRKPRSEAWATFSEWFRQRPDFCRYGVFEATDGRFGVWDLYEDNVLTSVATFGELRAPEPLLWAETSDGALMKTVMLYDD
jgi:hypothetical protein